MDQIDQFAVCALHACQDQIARHAANAALVAQGNISAARKGAELGRPVALKGYARRHKPQSFGDGIFPLRVTATRPS